MQKVIEAGLVNGNRITELFRKAYDLAATQHPEISQVLASRAAATPVQAATQTTKPIQSVKPSLASGGRGGQAKPRFKTHAMQQSQIGRSILVIKQVLRSFAGELTRAVIKANGRNDVEQKYCA